MSGKSLRSSGLGFVSPLVSHIGFSGGKNLLSSMWERVGFPSRQRRELLSGIIWE